jgi:hypothetical protein
VSSASDVIRPRIFISCGQRDIEEKGITSKLIEETASLGYVPYVAIYEQSTDEC